MTNQLIEYIKLHITSLEQDVEVNSQTSDGDEYWIGLELNAQINVLNHILQVAEDLDNVSA